MALVAGKVIGGISSHLVTRRLVEEVVPKLTVTLDTPPVSASEIKEFIDGINARDDFALIIHRNENGYVSASAGRTEYAEPSVGRLDIKMHGVLGNTASAVDRLRKDEHNFISIELFRILLQNYHAPYTEFSVLDEPVAHSVLLIYPYTPTPVERDLAEGNY